MPQQPDPDFERVRRQRNIVLAALLLGFVVLIFFISIAKMS